MTLYTTSAGILARKSSIQACLDQQVRPLSRHNHHDLSEQSDALVGWGMKPNAMKLKALSKELCCRFIHLEDGFIGYTGHPNAQGKAVSMIADKVGIYYDARQPSTLEQLINTPCDGETRIRAEKLAEQIVQCGITKYNCYPEYNAHHQLPDHLINALKGENMVLIVDQVSGDQSIAGALATPDDFLRMLESAHQRYPNAKLVVRTHPDTRLGRKSGILAKITSHALPDYLINKIIIESSPCHPHALIRAAKALFTVSSQMGFEALLLNKPVHCFGMPFYAGWGLTIDDKHCHRRQQVALPQLIAAALIQYPLYFDPVTFRPSTPEAAIALITQQAQDEPLCDTLHLLGFSFWKRAFIHEFCKQLAKNIKFINKVPAKLNENEKILVWGNRYPELTDAIRIEDGFIRSSGLGSNLARPSSLIIDPMNMYFNAQVNNTLRQQLNHAQIDEQAYQRGKTLISQLVDNDINKYNLIAKDQTSLAALKLPSKDNQGCLLVVGQVDGDASIVTGSEYITSNEALLWAVRKDNPHAFIIYKPHPDVVAGNREGEISSSCLQVCVDKYVTDISLTQLYPYIDALHTMTSLSGFEALLRNVTVVTWGQPFYAGWGLTEDKYPPKDRLRPLSLPILVYISVVLYPTYIDWDTRLRISPEQLITKMAKNKVDLKNQQSYWQRWQLKLSYLLETLRNT
ncbi:capsular polysaccharide biosynthesis protein [Shewanella surugensis]|uniref:Capsular polysaccharide biosynthesis protein n=1 Tax=Shewanella surugensis TaxID=212020 RepID=A0ABT0LFQ5_9GAMM|nr:capsular polysaccharide biosynthesis protein [Shewanella surugensis]MCL1126190.1 capsular polysaccharide biosynthesis protein [Shewanella surugensis]